MRVFGREITVGGVTIEVPESTIRELATTLEWAVSCAQVPSMDVRVGPFRVSTSTGTQQSIEVEVRVCPRGTPAAWPVLPWLRRDSEACGTRGIAIEVLWGVDHVKATVHSLRNGGPHET